MLSLLGFFISLVIRWLQLILPFVLPGASERVLCNLDGLARVRESSSSILAFADLRGLLIREPRIWWENWCLLVMYLLNCSATVLFQSPLFQKVKSDFIPSGLVPEKNEMGEVVRCTSSRVPRQLHWWSIQLLVSSQDLMVMRSSLKAGCTLGVELAWDALSLFLCPPLLARLLSFSLKKEGRKERKEKEIQFQTETSLTVLFCPKNLNSGWAK